MSVRIAEIEWLMCFSNISPQYLDDGLCGEFLGSEDILSFLARYNINLYCRTLPQTLSSIFIGA